jgi:hypothetical protein
VTNFRGTKGLESSSSSVLLLLSSSSSVWEDGFVKDAAVVDRNNLCWILGGVCGSNFINGDRLESWWWWWRWRIILGCDRRCLLLPLLLLLCLEEEDEKACTWSSGRKQHGRDRRVVVVVPTTILDMLRIPLDKMTIMAQTLDVLASDCIGLFLL